MDIFISYAREDEAKAVELETALRHSGLTVWRDRSMKAGAKIQQTIRDTIKTAKRTILIWTAISSKSRWVLAEAEYAAELGNLIPLIDGAPEIPLGLSDYHFEDYKRFLPSVAEFSSQLKESGFEQAYLEQIHRANGQIQILGMSKPIPLDQLYISLRVNTQIPSKHFPTMEHRSAGKSQDDHHNLIRRWKEKTSISPLDALKRYDKLILLGGPGSGKTTLLKYWSLLFSEKGMSDDKAMEPLFPILVFLRDIRQHGSTIWAAAQEQIFRAGVAKSSNLLVHRLSTGKCLVMLDGLDELEPDQTRDVHREVRELVSRFPLNKFVLSCRTASYLNNFEQFVEVEIEPFNQKQKYNFVENWFDETVKKSEALKRIIKLQFHISELATTPILLSLICILYDRNLSLPRNRTELYQRAVDAMLRDWDASRNFRRSTRYENLSDQKKMKLLSFVGFRFFDSGQKIFGSRELDRIVGQYVPRFGINALEARNVVAEVASHHGLILNLSANEFCFSHLSLQEYFPACHVVDARKEFSILENVGDPRWIEVFSSVASLLEDSTGFLFGILSAEYKDRFYKIYLSAYCVSAQTAVDPSMKSRIVKDLFVELDKASVCVRRLYRTHPTKGAKPGIFVEVHFDKKTGTVAEQIKNKRMASRFFACINCLTAYFDAAFIEEIQKMVEQSFDVKIARILEHLCWCKTKDKPVFLYSNCLIERGVMLPVEPTQFERRIENSISL